MLSSQKNMFSVILFAAFLTATLTFSHAAAYGEVESLMYLMKLLSFPQKPERFGGVNLKHPQPDVTSVSAFNWKSCGPATDPISADVKLSPDPLSIPGNITASGSANLKVDLVAPVKLALTIQKKVLVWITIPCIDEVGSCTYPDLCEKLAEQFPPAAGCPPPFSTYDLPCNCPIKAGSYTLPPSEIVVDDSGVPSFLTSGDYKVKAVMTSSSGAQLGCFDMEVSLK